VLNTAGALAFLCVLAAAADAARRHDGRARQAAVSRFIACVLLAAAAAGLTQHDLWPFAKWPMAGGLADPVAVTTRVRAVDEDGVEHDVDYRAWQPLESDELVPWLYRSFARLDDAQRAQVAAHLLAAAERGRVRARQGQAPGDFQRFLGAASAPYFDLHPRLWTAAERTPARPFAGLRIYRESWNQEERRRDPRKVERRLVYEYPP
jgi:hypothetical protein